MNIVLYSDILSEKQQIIPILTFTVFIEIVVLWCLDRYAGEAQLLSFFSRAEAEIQNVLHTNT